MADDREDWEWEEQHLLDVQDAARNVKGRIAEDAREPLLRGNQSIKNLGNTQILEFAEPSPTIFRNVPLIQASGDDDLPQLITLTLGLDATSKSNNPELDPVVPDTRTRARVSWGIGGSTFESTVDFTQGCMMTFAATFIRVVADSLYTGGPIPDGEVRRIKLAASLCYQPTTHAIRPARVLSTDITVGAGDTSLPEDGIIPRFATSATLLTQSPNGYTLPSMDPVLGPIPGSFVVLFQTSDALPQTIASHIPTSGTDVRDSMAIPGSESAVVLVRNNLPDTAVFRWHYTLAFG